MLINELSETFIIEKKTLQELSDKNVLAKINPVSGLYNKPEFQRKIRELSKKDNKTNTKDSIIFIDRNGLKSVNDNLGHGFGDNMLLSIAKTMTDIKMSIDNTNTLELFHISGDEFYMSLEDSKNKQNKKKVLITDLEKILKNNKTFKTFNDQGKYNLDDDGKVIEKSMTEILLDNFIRISMLKSKNPLKCFVIEELTVSFSKKQLQNGRKNEKISDILYNLDKDIIEEKQKLGIKRTSTKNYNSVLFTIVQNEDLFNFFNQHLKEAIMNKYDRENNFNFSNGIHNTKEFILKEVEKLAMNDNLIINYLIINPNIDINNFLKDIAKIKINNLENKSEFRDIIAHYVEDNSKLVKYYETYNRVSDIIEIISTKKTDKIKKDLTIYSEYFKENKEEDPKHYTKIETILKEYLKGLEDEKSPKMDYTSLINILKKYQEISKDKLFNIVSNYLSEIDTKKIQQLNHNQEEIEMK